MIIDVCAALANLLEPDPAIAKVALDLEPLLWEKDHLYVYPIRVEEVPFETATSRRQDFDLNAVLVVDNEGEEALSERSPELVTRLDGKRGDYLQVVRVNQAGPPWSMLRGTVDTASPRTLDNRSAAVRVRGWRIIGG